MNLCHFILRQHLRTNKVSEIQKLPASNPNIIHKECKAEKLDRSVKSFYASIRL